MSDLAKSVREEITRLLSESDPPISRSELSRRLKVSQPTIVEMLNGDGEIKTSTLENIAKALGFSVQVHFVRPAHRQSARSVPAA